VTALMKTKTKKLIVALSAVFAILFLLMQFVIRMRGSGAWCAPSLDAPHELGHPAYQFSDYGFPFPFLEIVEQDCFSAQATTYNWSPLALGIDGLLLVLLTLPVWSGLLRNYQRNKKVAPSVES
jgi:hypothetical protein